MTATISTTLAAAVIICLLQLLGIFGRTVSLADAFGRISNPPRYRCHYHHWIGKRWPCPATTRRIASRERPSSQTIAPFLPLVCRAASRSNTNTNTNVDNNSTSSGGNTTSATSTRTRSKPIHNKGSAGLTKESKRLIGLRPTIKVGKVWDIYMEELIKYNQTHGHINVPRFCKEYPQLSNFVLILRMYQGRLTLVQRDILNILGFIWKDAKIVKDQQKWLAMFERLQQYKCEFGDCNVPQNYTGGQIPSLGKWVSHQRTFYRQENLEKDRIDMLNSLGFVWKLRGGGSKPNDKLWEQHFQELKIFKLQFNHTNIPRTYKENKTLGKWVNNQRSHFFRETLLDDRKQRLEEIGFVWNFENARNSIWQVQFEKLKLHIEKYGMDAPIEQDPELSNWAAHQRLYKEKGRLDKRRKARLDKIGFNWDPNRTVNNLGDLARIKLNASSRNG